MEAEQLKVERSNDAINRNDQILDAAFALLVESGLEGFRIREVAQRAGMHHASLLYYFPNREELIRGIVGRIVVQLDRIPAPGSSDNALSPDQALHAHLFHVLAQVRDYPEHFIVLNELFLRAARDEDVRNVLTATDVSWRGYLVPLLTAGVEQGLFREDLDPPSAAIAVTSFFKGLTLQFGVPFEQLEQAVAQLERWLMKGGNAS